jgi:hypothetical protein
MGWRWCSWLAATVPNGPARPQDRATSGDPLRAAHGEVQARVQALLLVELLPAIADMPATDTRQCHGIGHAPTGAVLPELAAGVSQRLPSLSGAYRALAGLVEPGGF